MAEREQQIFKFLNAVPYGVQVIDAQASSVFVNDTGQKLLPILAEEPDIAEIQRRVFQADSGLPYPLEPSLLSKPCTKNKKPMPTTWWYSPPRAAQPPSRYRLRLFQ
ncbi:MAG: hypothetical protein HC912_03220 [Saprospiraceae bacterium]|nr:hypothetical protein [Saprospiraceae bacterium]